MKLENHVVLITGGASGIGLALAAGLLERNNTVVITGRSAPKLAKAKEHYPALATVEADCTDDAQMRRVIDRVVADHGRLSILVNNAGVMLAWDITKEHDAAALAKIDQQIATNLTAPIKLTVAALPVLVQQPEAAVVNITSGLAYAPIGKWPVYCATKAALHSFSKSLRHQLEHTNVKVFDVLPPGTATELAHDIKGKTIPAEVVAKEALKGIQKNHWEIPIGQSKTLHIMERIAPGFIEQQLLRAED